MEISDATVADLPSIQAIYAHHVLTGTGSFEDVPPALEEMAARLAAKREAGFSWLVAHDASGILGFGYYGPFRERAAYRYTVEDSVYVRDGVRGQGVGKAIVAALVERARAAGFKQMLALIGIRRTPPPSACMPAWASSMSASCARSASSSTAGWMW